MHRNSFHGLGVSVVLLLSIVLVFSGLGCKTTEEPTAPESTPSTYNITVNIPVDELREILQKVEVTISGWGMESVTLSQTVQDTTVTSVVFNNVEIAAGKGRLFTIAGKDTAFVILYWASERRDVPANTTVNLEVTLRPAGQGAASHIIIFRDALPWSTTAFEDMLVAEGFTQGPDSNQYQIFPSSKMYSTTLTPWEDLVVIQNDQSQGFYNTYAANSNKFNTFVYNGGSIFWEACDMGWQGGSMKLAGIVLPGDVNVDTEYVYDDYNYVVNSDYPLVQGLSDTIMGYYASHEYFVNLREGTIQYTMSVMINKPTLIQYTYGGGWVVTTAQPLEHGYAYGYPIGQLLPRVVRHFLGKSQATTNLWFPEEDRGAGSSGRR